MFLGSEYKWQFLSYPIKRGKLVSRWKQVTGNHMESKEHNVSYIIFTTIILSIFPTYTKNLVFMNSFLYTLSFKKISQHTFNRKWLFLYTSQTLCVDPSGMGYAMSSYAGFYFVSRTQDYEHNKVFIRTSLWVVLSDYKTPKIHVHTDSVSQPLSQP